MCEKETSERSPCITIGTCTDDPRSQSKDVCGLPEDIPDITLLDTFVHQKSYDEMDSLLGTKQALEKPVEREQFGVGKSGNTQNSVEMKEEEFPKGTKIHTDDSSKKDSGGMDPLDKNSIPNVTTEHMEGKASTYCHVKALLNLRNQTTRSIAEDRQVDNALPDRFFSDCKNSFSPFHNTVSINNSLKNVHFIDTCGCMPSPFSLAQKAAGTESNIPKVTLQVPKEEDFISIRRLKGHYPAELQAPSLHVPRKVSSIALNPTTVFSDPVPLLAQQEMFVPNECHSIYRFSQNYSNEVIITKQKSRVLDSSPAQTGSRNPQIPLYTSQTTFPDSGQISVSNPQPLNVFASSSSRHPQYRTQCSSPVIRGLKMKLKKHSTGERHHPYTNPRPNIDLLPKLDEFLTPF